MRYIAVHKTGGALDLLVDHTSRHLISGTHIVTIHESTERVAVGSCYACGLVSQGDG